MAGEFQACGPFSRVNVIHQKQVRSFCNVRQAAKNTAMCRSHHGMRFFDVSRPTHEQLTS